jgi:hypothetical protein
VTFQVRASTTSRLQSITHSAHRLSRLIDVLDGVLAEDGVVGPVDGEGLCVVFPKVELATNGDLVGNHDVALAEKSRPRAAVIDLKLSLAKRTAMPEPHPTSRTRASGRRFSR